MFFNFISKFKYIPENKSHKIYFSIDKNTDKSDIVVIRQKNMIISPNVLNKKVVLFIQPDTYEIKNYILKYESCLGVYYNDIPPFARYVMNIKDSKYGNLIVINPIKKFPNTIWTVKTRINIFDHNKINNYFYTKLNIKPMSSTLTFSDLFMLTNRPSNTHIYVNVDNEDNVEIKLYPKCYNCEIKNICRYRIYRSYRNVYPTCDEYKKDELMNLNRLAYIYNKLEIDKYIQEEENPICTKDIKEKIYAFGI